MVNAEVKMPKCTKCWDKGFASVMYGTIGSEDFGGDGFFTPPAIHKEFCNCARGKALKKLEKLT